MKKITFLIFIFFMVLFVNTKVGAEVICNIKLPMEQGVSADRYSFVIEKIQNPKREFEIFYTVKYESTISDSGLLKNLFNKGSNATNLGSQSGLENYFSNERITSIDQNSECPKYVWIGPKIGYKPTKYGIIFSDSPVKIHTIGDYYNVYNDIQEGTMDDQEYIDKTIKEYDELYTKLDGLIEGHYAKSCSKLLENETSIRRFEGILAYYSNYIDKDKGEDLKRRLNLALSYCRTEGYEVGDSGEFQPGGVQSGCEVIPESIRKWINNILNIIKYVALALVIALGALDFMKAAGSGEADAMKKAGQSFIKRLVAVVVLFLVPVIVELILNLINLYGVNPDNINCLK